MLQLQKGDPAPDFETLDDSGRKVRLSDFRGRKVLLYFYPKDHSSGCTTQACLFRDHYQEITRAGALVLGISPDGPDSHRHFREKHRLPFPLLVDPEQRIAKSYGVWGKKSMYGRSYMGILRSHFLIDEEGLIREARYRVSPRKSLEWALQALREQP